MGGTAGEQASDTSGSQPEEQQANCLLTGSQDASDHFADLQGDIADLGGSEPVLESVELQSSFASEGDEDTNSDSSEPTTADASHISNVITSAEATWCVHQEASKADADPVVSFFAQLISSHSLAKAAAEVAEPPAVSSGSSSCTLEAGPTTKLSSDRSSPDASTCGRPADEKSSGRVLEAQKLRGNGLAVEGGTLQFKRAEGSCVADDCIDTQLKEHVAASLKRANFPHILGSIRSAILDNPQIFGFCSSEATTEGGDERKQCASVSANCRQPAKKHGFIAQLGADLGESLLPPAIPVDREFCRVNPRLAVSWLAQTRLNEMLEGRLPEQHALGTQRLDRRTQAQLACLVAPESLMCQPHAMGAATRSTPNPARGALKKMIDNITGSLDVENAEALADLLHSWYYSGFFAGQLEGVRNAWCL